MNIPKQLRNFPDRSLLKNLESGLDLVEAALEKAVAHTDPIAKVTARHLSSAGGKRIRPALVLLAAQLGEGTTQHVIDSAVVVELTHLATLYHDDVMDNAPTRRGVPTAHNIWGNSVAILTGDLLFARASQVVSRIGERALVLQADTFERLCLGQLHETVGPQEGDDPIDHYIRVLADKTGSLIAAAAEMGIMFSGAPEEFREPLRIYGENVGIAFQLMDDVIDIASDGSVSGKTPGTDLLAGVATLPILLLRQAAADTSNPDAEATALLARIDGGLTPETLGDVVAQLRDSKALRDTHERAKAWAQAAVDALGPLPEGSPKQALITFARAIVDRDA